MYIFDLFETPVGDIIIYQCNFGRLETVSHRSYDRSINTKADFLDLSSIPSPVKHQEPLPFSKRWDIHVSNLYQCFNHCEYCMVPRIPYPVTTVSRAEIVGQIADALKLHKEVSTVDELYIHIDRIGEPTYNSNVISAMRTLYYDHTPVIKKIIPSITTIMPNNNVKLSDFIDSWIIDIKNTMYAGQADIKIVVNSTNANERDEMFLCQSHTLNEIARIINNCPFTGKKYVLNFAVAHWEINPYVLIDLFNPDEFMVRLIPTSRTQAAIDSHVLTYGGNSQYDAFKQHEENLRSVGYDVEVVLTSDVEELSCITPCHSILGGSNIGVEYKQIIKHGKTLPEPLIFNKKNEVFQEEV